MANKVNENEEVENVQEAAADEGLDFSLFTGGDAGYQVLSNEKLKSLSKKLPSWSLEPPSKYVK